MYTERELFGGALSCCIPTAWRDVSDVRQVPDHQEVWQEMEGSVLVIEILQHQDEVEDANAASFFFHDLAESNGVSDSNDYKFEAATFSFPTTTIHGATTSTGVGLQKIAMGRDYDINGQRRENQETRWTRIELCVFRLPHVHTDLLLTITGPMPNPNEPPLQSQDHTVVWSELFQRAVSSIRVRDWTIFA